MEEKDMKTMNRQAAEVIRDAEMILVGIGEEFVPELPAGPECQSRDPQEQKLQDGIAGALSDQKFRDGQDAQAEQDISVLEPYRRSLFYDTLPEEHEVLQAYRRLRKMAGARPCFVVTLNTDDLIYRAFEEDLVVAPCGSIHKMQCGAHIVDGRPVRDRILENVGSLTGKHPSSDQMAGAMVRKQAVCPQCGRPLQFHVKDTEGYMESGYLPQWERYTRWLSCTLNRRLCILELGVGFRFPQVIRWPFEKTAYFNQKATLIRVSSRFPQLAQEIADRGIGIAQSPVQFLLER